MTQAANEPYTYAEYLALEEKSIEKHEYYQGEVIVMAGGSSEHTAIAVNVAGSLIAALRPTSCRVFGSDLKIRIAAVDYSTYGDVIVTCGELDYYQGRSDIITNPLLIVEVLSPATRNFDQSKKFELYRNLASFEHYLLVDAERMYVEYRQKNGFFWQVSYYTELSQTVKLQLPPAETALNLNLIYEKVRFPPPTPLKPRSRRAKK